MGADMVLVGAEKFLATGKGLEVNGEVSFEEWKDVGRRLLTIAENVSWAIGDWLRYGKGKGEWSGLYEKAMDEFDRSYGTLRNLASVAGAFPVSRRRDNLSWSHHAAVQGLEPKDADALLDLADDDSWTLKRLREEVAEFKGEKKATSAPKLAAPVADQDEDDDLEDDESDADDEGEKETQPVDVVAALTAYVEELHAEHVDLRSEIVAALRALAKRLDVQPEATPPPPPAAEKKKRGPKPTKCPACEAACGLALKGRLEDHEDPETGETCEYSGQTPAEVREALEKATEKRDAADDGDPEELDFERDAMSADGHEDESEES